jgi:hypothetical protein
MGHIYGDNRGVDICSIKLHKTEKRERQAVREI